MDKMNILLKGKKMPVSFSSKYIYVPKGTTEAGSHIPSGSMMNLHLVNEKVALTGTSLDWLFFQHYLLFLLGKSYLEKADLFWGQINENTPFVVGGETGGTDSPLLNNNQILSAAGGGANHERSGTGSRSKKDGLFFPFFSKLCLIICDFFKENWQTLNQIGKKLAVVPSVAELLFPLKCMKFVVSV
jgi:hypothetical protein